MAIEPRAARRRLRGAAAVAVVLAAAFAAQAWAGSHGHSLGGLGLVGFGALAAVAWLRLTRTR